MSKEIVKNYGKSIRSKLLNIAKSEGIYYQTVLTRYFQERLIYRMSQTPYRQNFYLKGGALMYAHERFAGPDRHWTLTSSATTSATTAKESLLLFARYVLFLAKKTE